MNNKQTECKYCSGEKALGRISFSMFLMNFYICNHEKNSFLETDMKATAVGDPFYECLIAKIKYCPMCGKKLGTEMEE